MNIIPHSIIFLLRKEVYFHFPSGPASEEQVSRCDFYQRSNDLGGQRFFSYVDNSSKTNYLTGNIVTKQNTYDSNGNLTTYREDFDDGSYNITN